MFSLVLQVPVPWRAPLSSMQKLTHEIRCSTFWKSALKGFCSFLQGQWDSATVVFCSVSESLVRSRQHLWTRMVGCIRLTYFFSIYLPTPAICRGARPRKSAVKAEWLQKAMLTPASESSAILPLFSPFALKFQAQTYLQINDALPEMFAKSSSRSITKNDTNRK